MYVQVLDRSSRVRQCFAARVQCASNNSLGSCVGLSPIVLQKPLDIANADSVSDSYTSFLIQIKPLPDIVDTLHFRVEKIST